METLATTRMTSKGQDVIPESVRKQLILGGTQWIAIVVEGVGIYFVTSQSWSGCLSYMNEVDCKIITRELEFFRSKERLGVKRTNITSANAKARDRK